MSYYPAKTYFKNTVVILSFRRQNSEFTVILTENGICNLPILMSVLVWTPSQTIEFIMVMFIVKVYGDDLRKFECYVNSV